MNIFVTIFTTAGIPLFLLCQQTQGQATDYVIHQFEKIQLSSTFYAEGAGIGDLNGDDHPDVVAGPYWYEGPDFTSEHAFYEPQMVDPREYSDNFIAEVDDVNGDGRNDILMVGFPGEAARWYENPGDGDDYWESHLIHRKVDNESPQFYDLNRDGTLELVFHTDGQLGYAERNEEDPTRPWSFTPVSRQHDWGKFTHGLGIGDIDGDGLEDIIKKEIGADPETADIELYDYSEGAVEQTNIADKNPEVVDRLKAILYRYPEAHLPRPASPRE